MNDHSVVFVTNMSPEHHYDSASKYGAVRPITTGNYPVFKTARLVEEISTALVQSGPEDYLLFSGSSFVAGLCLAVWLSIHKKCKALLYDKAQRGYVPRVIEKSELHVQIEKQRDKLENTA